MGPFSCRTFLASLLSTLCLLSSQAVTAGDKKEPPPSFIPLPIEPDPVKPPLDGGERNEQAFKKLINALIGIAQTTPQSLVPIDPPPAADFTQSQFTFKINPKTPVKNLLPTPPVAQAKAPPLLNEDLTKVREVTFGEPISRRLAKEKSLKETAHIIAKINHLNKKKHDGFMEAMIANRTDLRGMPFRMGDECRTCEAEAKVFAQVADFVHTQVRQAKQADIVNMELVEKFWTDIAQMNTILVTGNTKEARTRIPRADQEYMHRATVAALMQILGPESETFRAGMARFLATIPHIDATRALARLAIFSPEDEVRTAAIEGLKLRRDKDYTEILMQGFRYPLPAVSKRAADALVKLERKDLLVNLLEVLEQPDPRLPTTRRVGGKEVSVVRELVKVNHHRNCLLCHAPGNTPDVPEGVLTVAVPLPSEPFPKPADGGYQNTPPASPDIVVRLDMTYLRQDFSMMMRVSDPAPWPDMQRFDFLVQTRVLTSEEALKYEVCCEIEEPGRLSPYHRSALFALRELTGRDTEPTPQAWRRLLKLPGGQTQRTP